VRELGPIDKAATFWAFCDEPRGGGGVQRSDFRDGQRWALRASRVLGGEAVKVRLVAYPQGARKVKVIHEGGELDGMDEWVNPTALIVPWSQWRKRLASEKREVELRHHVETVGLPDGATATAISHVLESTGEHEVWLDERRGIAQGPEAALHRIADRAGLTVEQRSRLTRSPACRDSGLGEWRIPWERAHDLAMAFARAEPDAVSLHLETQEEDYKRRGYADGDRFFHRYLIEQRPGLALARDWASGHDEQVKFLNDRIHELERLLSDVAERLEATGEQKLADRVRRKLR
jgi:hypothetical protein